MNPNPLSIDAQMAISYAVDSVSFGECNAHFHKLYAERLHHLAGLKGCDITDLTLREIQSCHASASLQYNDAFPNIFPGHTSRSPAEILGHQPQGALV
jgi:hypothetical protein